MADSFFVPEHLPGQTQATIEGYRCEFESGCPCFNATALVIGRLCDTHDLYSASVNACMLSSDIDHHTATHERVLHSVPQAPQKAADHLPHRCFRALLKRSANPSLRGIIVGDGVFEFESPRQAFDSDFAHGFPNDGWDGQIRARDARRVYNALPGR